MEEVEFAVMDHVLVLGVRTTFMDEWMARGSHAGFAPFAQQSFEIMFICVIRKRQTADQTRHTTRPALSCAERCCMRVAKV